MPDSKYEGIYSELTDRIISAAIDVHKELGCGLKEEAYEAILAFSVNHPVFAYQCRTYLRMMDLPVGLVLNFGFPTLKEGLEHVDNLRASNPPNLRNSFSPGSESNAFSSPLIPSPDLLNS